MTISSWTENGIRYCSVYIKDVGYAVFTKKELSRAIRRANIASAEKIY